MKDVSSLRDFPLLRGAVYLNNAAHGALPASAEDVMRRYWEDLSQFRDAFFERWWDEMHRYREALAALIGGAPGTVVTGTNLSTFLGQIMSCASLKGRRRRVVTTDLHFPTVDVTLRAMEARGFEVRRVASADGVSSDVGALLDALDDTVYAVCVPHASASAGALLPLGAVGKKAREVGALSVVDAYQTVGCVPIDVKAASVDFLISGAHKWQCGGFACAWMYVRPELSAQLSPIPTGWMAGEDPLTFADQPGLATDARRFMTGTPDLLPAMLSRPGLAWLGEVGVGAIRDKSLTLTGRLMARADELGLCVATPRADDARASIVSLRFAGDRAATTWLKERGFIVSYRQGLRISPHYYNDLREVDACMDALGAHLREEAT